MKKQEVFHKIKCRLCESKKLKTVYHLNPQPIGDDYVKNKNKKQKLYPLNLDLCEKCKFVQLSHVLNPDIVYGKYLYVTQTSSGLPEHFKNLIKQLFKEKIIKKKSKVLEIGSNDGTLLNFIGSYGCKVLGVDPAKDLAKKTKFKTIVGKFDIKLSNKINSKYGVQDLIIANNVIANIDNLKDVFKGISSLLSADGHFVMETFSLKGVIEKNLLDNIYHEHLSYFTINSLVRFAKKFNLNIYSAEHITVKGGSIRFIFSKKKRKINEKSLIKSISVEKKLGLGSPASFIKLKKKNNILKKKILSFVQTHKKKNSKFVGYGASIGTTTLIYEFGLGKYIDNLFDDEKRRHNLYSPGYKIKVLSPKEIKAMKNFFIIIFAWRYSQIILKKSKKYIKKNDVFILPLPKFKILKK
jgi:2-polyprenyl-3-methyl-5-hydroxy-6-metoxy-1,4-benzoquinol methylase